MPIKKAHFCPEFLAGCEGFIAEGLKFPRRNCCSAGLLERVLAFFFEVSKFGSCPRGITQWIKHSPGTLAARV